MPFIDYSRGLHELGDGCFGYLQPDGGWGWSNAGLVVGDGASLLVDTLFDLHLTADMLDSMSLLTDSAPVGSLVNTHANGDHCYGNSEVATRWPTADIVASSAAADERFADLGEYGRVAVNVDTVYRSSDAGHQSPDVVEQFRRMAPIEAH